MNETNNTIASGGKRIYGGIVDLILLFFFALFFGYLTGLAETTVGDHSFDIAITGWSFLLALVCYCLLLAVMEYKTGKSPGKYLVKIKVVSEEFTKITFRQALIRNMARFIDGLAFYLVGLIIIIFDKKNQRLGDLLAKTLVITE